MAAASKAPPEAVYLLPDREQRIAARRAVREEKCPSVAPTGSSLQTGGADRARVSAFQRIAAQLAARESDGAGLSVESVEVMQLGVGEQRILEGKRNFSRALAAGDNKVRQTRALGRSTLF